MLSIQAPGQDTTTTTTKHKFFIGLNLSPDYCGRVITQNGNTLSNANWSRVKAMEDSIFKPKFGHSLGITLEYQIGNRLYFESGLQFSNKGYKTIPIMTLYDPFNPDGSVTEATNIISHNYLDLPLKVKLYFLKNKFQLLTSVGATLNYLLRVSIKTIPTVETEEFKVVTHIIDYPYNKINISPTISFGAKYNFNDKMNVQVAPTFRYGLLKLDNKDYKIEHLWSAGININLYYKL